MTKTKTIIAALTLAFSGCAFAQESAILAKVVSVTPIETMRPSIELTAPVCSITYVQVARTVAVPVFREQPAPSPLLGMIVGAAIGSQVFKGDGRAAGTLLGAAVAYGALGGNAQPHNYGHQTYQNAVQYQTQYVMEPRESCQTFHETVYKPVISGYRVTYILNGQTNTIMMNRHPGEHVRIVTSYRVES